MSIPNFETTLGVPIQGRTIEGDLLTIFWAFNDASSNLFASAAPHAFMGTNGRPIAGEFNINLKAINPTPANELLHFSTFIHEFYHIVVFNSELFEKFVDASNRPIGYSSFVSEGLQVGGKSRNGYKGPGVLSRARTHLGDSSL